MIRYKEFWFGLSLLALVVFYCVMLKAVDDIGQYWVQVLHPYAQTKGIVISDKAIYTSKTRDEFIWIGSSLAVFLVGLGIEIFLLVKRLRTANAVTTSIIVFYLALAPFIYAAGRVLVNMYKMDLLF